MGRIAEEAAKARAYRDASPVEKIDMDIADLEKRRMTAAMIGLSLPDIVEGIKKLRAEKARLTGAP